jgi:hypothetical protein
MAIPAHFHVHVCRPQYSSVLSFSASNALCHPAKKKPEQDIACDPQGVAI